MHSMLAGSSERMIVSCHMIMLIDRAVSPTKPSSPFFDPFGTFESCLGPLSNAMHRRLSKIVDAILLLRSTV